jgi:hypothetical protein
MSIRGVFGQPFLNLDPLIDVTRFNGLLNELLVGISTSWIDKGVVSCGSRESETMLELCQVLKSPENFLTPEQVQTLARLPNLHQKAWYCSLLLPVHHPYSLVFLRREREFWKKQFADHCDWTGNADYFPETVKFIRTLPFEQIGRILIFITEPNCETIIHYDGGHPQALENENTEMIYFRPMLRKKLFIWDESLQKKQYVEGCASFWNDLDWHGVDAAPGKTFSLRVDGVFKETFRRQLKQLSEVQG